MCAGRRVQGVQQESESGRRARWSHPVAEVGAPSGRFHYAIINGGGAPNVTPDMCSIWFFVREGSPARAQVLYDKIVECGKAAAQASQTRLVHTFHSGAW